MPRSSASRWAGRSRGLPRSACPWPAGRGVQPAAGRWPCPARRVRARLPCTGCSVFPLARLLQEVLTHLVLTGSATFPHDVLGFLAYQGIIKRGFRDRVPVVAPNESRRAGGARCPTTRIPRRRGAYNRYAVYAESVYAQPARTRRRNACRRTSGATSAARFVRATTGTDRETRADDALVGQETQDVMRERGRAGQHQVGEDLLQQPCQRKTEQPVQAGGREPPSRTWPPASSRLYPAPSRPKGTPSVAAARTPSPAAGRRPRPSVRPPCRREADGEPGQTGLEPGATSVLIRPPHRTGPGCRTACRGRTPRRNR